MVHAGPIPHLAVRLRVDGSDCFCLLSEKAGAATSGTSSYRDLSETSTDRINIKVIKGQECQIMSRYVK